VSNFTGEISTNISSFGVNTTTDSSEESDGGTTEAISGDVLEEHTYLHLNLLATFFGLVGVRFSDNNWLVDEDEDLEDDESKSNEHEAENLSTSESNIKAFMNVDSTLQGDLDVSVGSNLHSDESAEHGGDGTNNEGESSERERDLVLGLVGHPRHIDGAYEDDGEDGAENGEVSVFFPQESDSTLFDVFVSLHHAVKTGLIGPWQEVERLVSLLVGILVDSNILDIRFDVFDLDSLEDSPE